MYWSLLPLHHSFALHIINQPSGWTSSNKYKNENVKIYCKVYLWQYVMFILKATHCDPFAIHYVLFAQFKLTLCVPHCTLCCLALHQIILHCTALYYIVLHWIELYCIAQCKLLLSVPHGTLNSSALYYCTLRCLELHCNIALRCIAMPISKMLLHCTVYRLYFSAGSCSPSLIAL